MRRLLLALTMTVAAVGCGDSGVSRADYIAEADAFCKDRNDEAKDRNQELLDIATKAHSEEEFLAKATPVLEDGLDWARDTQEQFDDIEPPEADKETIDELSAAIGQELDALEKAVDAARDRDFDRFTDLANEQEKTDDRANEIARDYGFKECGSEANEAEASS